jgi:hypothetical protein
MPGAGNESSATDVRDYRVQIISFFLRKGVFILFCAGGWTATRTSNGAPLLPAIVTGLVMAAYSPTRIGFARERLQRGCEPRVELIK